MLSDDLRALLQALRDGSADVAEVRAALARSGLEDADALIGDDPVADAALLLELLDGGDAPWSAPLRDALAGEHGDADVVASVMAELAAGPEVGVAGAVRHEAGSPPELAGRLDPDALPVAEAVCHEAGAAPELATAFDPGALPIARAVEAEAGRAPELAAGFDADAWPIAEAVAHEAGTIDIAGHVIAQVADPDGLPEAWVSALLDRALPEVLHVRAAERAAADPSVRLELAGWADVGRMLREELVREAGPAPSLWHDVGRAIGLADPERVDGWDEQLLGEVVRAEAGVVDVVAGVLERVGRDARVPEPEVGEPANAGAWAGPAIFGALAAAAILVFALWGGRVPTGGPGPLVESPDVTFASAEELQIDQVRYGENASVFVEVPEDAGAPVVIWVDDGGQL